MRKNCVGGVEKMHKTVNSERTLATAEALDGMAEALEKRALRIKRRADSLRGRVRLDAAVESYKQSWRTVARLMDAGLDFDEAVKVTAQRLHTSERTIRHHWDERSRRTKSVSLWERDREIMRLAAAGYTNKQIAERLAQLGWCSPSRPGKPMAPGSISRIITKRLGR